MIADFRTLLDATIQHLHGLKRQGVRFVNVAEPTLAELGQPPTRPPGHCRGRAAATSGNTTPTGDKLASREEAARPGPAPAMDASPAPATTPTSHAAVATADTEAERMAALGQQALVCRKCPHLAATRKSVVFGVGDIRAQLMFVGEAPGSDEDAQGEPFVGAAGQLLTKIIQAMGLTRATVYIANILKCRPDTPGQVTGNRKPTPEEMQTCIPYLHAQIDLIQPKVLVALGGTALEGLLGQKLAITKVRGQWQTCRGILLMPTYHPAYLLYHESRNDKRKVWEDMLQVMDKLGLPISEKQRRFFLSGRN